MSVVQSVQELGAAMPNWPPSEIPSRLTDGLADALGWKSDGARLGDRVPSTDQHFLTQGLLGNQPAVVFAAGQGSASGDLLDLAALFAYHSLVEWGVATTPRETIVFNSHWLRQGDWFQLPPIRWNQPQAYTELLEAITPDGLTSGRIDRVATGHYEPDKLLLPVDSLLVERLDFWRGEALRYAREIVDIDEKLQTLFAQLFVLRAIEDRDLAPQLPSVEAVCDASGEVDFARLDLLFEQARDHVQSELFDEVVHRDFPEFVLSGIIRELYTPHGLPHRGYRYNFSWLDSDVLGSAYERYLSTLLVPVPSVSRQLRMFEQPLRDYERASVRKQAGVYYTPTFLVNYLTERALDCYYDVLDHDDLPRIADFSCGSGSFLTQAVDSLIQRLQARNPERNWGREIVQNECIIGVDNDRRAVALARLSLWLRLTEEPDPLPLPRLHEVIVHGDSLSEDVFSDIPSAYDIILGNPPFIATGKFPSREELATRFQTAQGRYDYAYLFLELAINRLREDGILGMIVPNRLFRNRNAETIRGILSSEMKMLTVIDFGSTEVFRDTSSYIGTILAEKTPTRCPEDLVRVIKVHQLPPRLAGTKLLEADRSSGVISDEYLEAYDARHPPGPASWLLLSSKTRRTRVRLEELSEPLDSVAGIYQGIRTGANDVFIVEMESHSGGVLAEIRNALGDVSLVERSLLRPVVFGSDVRRYEIVQPDKYLVYPYDAGETIPERRLRLEYPHTYRYLSRFEALLTGRKSLAGTGLEWYELVRKRDEEWLESSKLLIRDLATKPAFALDAEGTTFLVGGTAVVPADASHLLALMGYLNSAVAEWYLEHITPSFKSGFQKFEPQHLRRLPVPPAIVQPGYLGDELTDVVLSILDASRSGNAEAQRQYEGQLDDLLLEGLELEASEIR